MMRKIQKRLAGLLVSLYLFSLSGCVYLVVGTVGALGGYVVSPDTVQGIVADKTTQEVWNSAVHVVGIMGTIEEQNETGGILIADLQGTKVTLTITPISQSTIKLSVKARRALLPKIRTAQDVYIKIERDLYKTAPPAS